MIEKIKQFIVDVIKDMFKEEYESAKGYLLCAYVFIVLTGLASFANMILLILILFKI